MKKITFLFAASFLFCCSFVSADNKPIISETVKIISYNLTNNNHVIEKSLASGTIISEDGLVLTNHHVVTDENDESYEAFAICTVSNKQEKPDCLYTASLIAKDKSLDIALLKINAKDIYGQQADKFPYLDYKSNELPEIGENIELLGFPGIGGKTITSTEGTVSGFDEKEGIKSIKTDATISPGNSGGTAINNNGNFIGVPSYLKSYYTTIGYIVPLIEVNPWLEKIVNNNPQVDQFSDSLLRKLLEVQYEAEQNKNYESNIFPYYQIKVPEPWKIEFINDATFIITNTVQGHDLNFSIDLEFYPYLINDDFMNFILKKIEKNSHNYANYTRREAEIAGLKGYLINYDSWENRIFYFFAPIENTIFSYYYSVPLENENEINDAFDKVLNTLKITSGENNTSLYLQKYSQDYPNISMSTYDDFYVNPIYDSQNEESIVYIENPNSFEQSFTIAEKYIPKDYWNLTHEKILDEEIKYVNGKLVNKYSSVVIDGLKGFAYTTIHQGDDVNETKKETRIWIFKDDKKYFEIVYEDLLENYDNNIETVVKILNTLSYNGEENKNTKGTYDIPEFRMFYEDIKYHLYETEINALASKNILNFVESNFYPEKPITRIKALEAILESKVFIEEGRKSTETKNGVENASLEKIFEDFNIPRLNKFLNYSLGREIISKNQLFHPYENITLAQALKILCKTYELPVWNPPYSDKIEWYLPYVYRGEILGVIPAGLIHDSVLTRGQFASLLYDFVRIVGERYDL